MTYETVLFERDGHIATITLNRPEVRNAINGQIWRELGMALEQFSQDSELWVAILTGAGDRAFCAGADLKEKAAGTRVITEEMKRWGFAGIAQHHISKPIIAAVNGFALGGGVEIALSCDLVVASEQATFGLPEVKRGLIAGAGGLFRLPRQIPLKIAMEAILTGNPLTAQEAREWGLVNRVVPHSEVLSVAKALAQEIVENSPIAVSASKEIVIRGLLNTPPEPWDLNEHYLSQVMASDDAKEGVSAFTEKRKPVWKGK